MIGTEQCPLLTADMHAQPYSDVVVALTTTVALLEDPLVSNVHMQ